jgi:hypothetical protein
MDAVAQNSRQTEDDAGAVERDASDMQLLQHKTSPHANYDVAFDMRLIPVSETTEALIKSE